ncbi:MAG: M56 family metallopeptidase, partial [Pricia sp.]
MILFLLKSSACLAIFLMFYKLLLENERMHTFKRFYLLAALVISLVIPSITFVEYVEASQEPTLFSAANDPVENIYPETTTILNEASAPADIKSTESNYWFVVLWTVYGLGVLLFSLKFLINLRKIAHNIRNNPKLKIDRIINVLLKDAVVPHTFLNYIFLHRAAFDAQKIPKDVLVHEATHARQKHSLDILFIELLQIVFWFNPLFHFAKKSIKLNHEFLADAAVLKQGSATSEYQNILLAFASSTSHKDRQPSMANAINYSSYSSIKKRFTVMKTQTSKKSIFVRSILFLPLLAGLVYGFSSKKTIYEDNPSEIHAYANIGSECENIEHHTIRLYKDELHIDGKVLDSGTDWLSYLRDEYAGDFENEDVSETHFILINENNVQENIEALLSAYSGGVWQVHERASRSEIDEYNRLSKIYNAIPIEERTIPLKDLKIIETIY